MATQGPSFDDFALFSEVLKAYVHKVGGDNRINLSEGGLSREQAQLFVAFSNEVLKENKTLIEKEGKIYLDLNKDTNAFLLLAKATLSSFKPFDFIEPEIPKDPRVRKQESDKPPEPKPPSLDNKKPIESKKIEKTTPPQKPPEAQKIKPIKIIGKREQKPTIVAQLMSGNKDPVEFQDSTSPAYNTQNYESIASIIYSHVTPQQFFKDLLEAYNTIPDDKKIDFITNAKLLIAQMVLNDPQEEYKVEMEAGLTEFVNKVSGSASDTVKESLQKIKNEITIVMNTVAEKNRDRNSFIEKKLDNGSYDIDKYIKSLATRMKRRKFPDTDEMAKNVAQDLKEQNLKLFLGIKRSEFYNQSHEKNSDSTVNKFISNANSITNMVINDLIFNSKSKKHLKSIYRFYVKLIEESFKLNDLCTASTICSALNMKEITDLFKPKKPPLFKIYTNLQGLVFKPPTEIPYIPAINIVIRDLTFAYESVATQKVVKLQNDARTKPKEYNPGDNPVEIVIKKFVKNQEASFPNNKVSNQEVNLNTNVIERLTTQESLDNKAIVRRTTSIKSPERGSKVNFKEAEKSMPRSLILAQMKKTNHIRKKLQDDITAMLKVIAGENHITYKEIIPPKITLKMDTINDCGVMSIKFTSALGEKSKQEVAVLLREYLMSILPGCKFIQEITPDAEIKLTGRDVEQFIEIFSSEEEFVSLCEWDGVQRSKFANAPVKEAIIKRESVAKPLDFPEKTMPQLPQIPKNVVVGDAIKTAVETRTQRRKSEPQLRGENVPARNRATSEPGSYKPQKMESLKKVVISPKVPDPLIAPVLPLSARSEFPKLPDPPPNENGPIVISKRLSKKVDILNGAMKKQKRRPRRQKKGFVTPEKKKKLHVENPVIKPLVPAADLGPPEVNPEIHDPPHDDTHDPPHDDTHDAPHDDAHDAPQNVLIPDPANPQPQPDPANPQPQVDPDPVAELLNKTRILTLSRTNLKKEEVDKQAKQLKKTLKTKGEMFERVVLLRKNKTDFLSPENYQIYQDKYQASPIEAVSKLIEEKKNLENLLPYIDFMTNGVRQECIDKTINKTITRELKTKLMFFEQLQAMLTSIDALQRNHNRYTPAQYAKQLIKLEAILDEYEKANVAAQNKNLPQPLAFNRSAEILKFRDNLHVFANQIFKGMDSKTRTFDTTTEEQKYGIGKGKYRAVRVEHEKSGKNVNLSFSYDRDVMFKGIMGVKKAAIEFHINKMKDQVKDALIIAMTEYGKGSSSDPISITYRPPAVKQPEAALALLIALKEQAIIQGKNFYVLDPETNKKVTITPKTDCSDEEKACFAYFADDHPVHKAKTQEVTAGEMLGIDTENLEATFETIADKHKEHQEAVMDKISKEITQAPKRRNTIS